MADLQISQLPQLAEADLAAGDELAVVDGSASETKRITAKALVEKGVALIDAGSIPGSALAALGANTVVTASITDLNVTASKIANATITATQIANATITGAKLVNDTITATQIAANAIGASELADDAVDTAAILDAAVTNDKIANATIAYAKLNLSDGDIPGAKLTNDSVTATQIAANAVGASELADDAVDTNAIANLAVTSGKLATNSVTASKITDGVITGAKLVNDTITATQIAANAITASELADDAVDTNAILDDAVTAAKLAAGAVDTTALGAAAVTGAKIASTTITAANIAAGTITATELAADSVGASEIAANAVGASELADDAVDTAAIVNAAVTNAKIADATITYAKLNLSDGDIPAAKIAAGAIGNTQIAANAVGATELANDAVDTAAIQNLAVTGAKIAASTITGAKIAATTIEAGNIAANTITASEIAANAIGASELADNAVDTAAIVDAAITNDKIANTTIAYAKLNLSNGDIAGAKIADNSLTATQIAANAIGSSELADNAVDTSAIADDAVTGAKIAAATIEGANIATGTITATQLAADSVGASEIAANAVGASELADDAVDTAAIANLAITGAKIANATVTAAKLSLSAGDIDGTKIANDSITATQIAANAITASELADDAVDTAAIANNAVTAAKIAANAVGASELADDAVDTAAIADGAVTAAKISGTLNTATIADNAITTAKIADDAVTSAKLGANAVDAAALANTAVGTAAIADAAVTAAKIGTGAVTNAKLGADAVTAAKITDGTITAAKLATANIDRSLNVASGNLGINNVISAGTSAGITYNAQGLITATTALVASDLPVATATAVGSVSVPTAGGLTVSGAGALSIAATTTGATATKVTFNSFGQITGTATLGASDLPVATASAVGAVSVPTGGPLSIDSNGAITVSDSGVTAGVGTKLTVDAKGRVTNLASLSDSDLPNHSAALITSGSIPTARIANDAITGVKLANASTTLFGSVAQTGFPTSEFTGQFFFDSVSEDLYIYDGNAYQPVTTLTKGSLVFGGTFNASTSKVASVTTAGAAAGLTVGSNVPTPTTSTDGLYLVVEASGTPSAPAPVVALAPPDYILGVTNTSGSSWEEIDLSQTVAGQVASNITFTPFGQLQSTNVQDALEELETEKLAKAGGTVTGEVLIGNTGTLVFEGSSTDAYQTTLGVVNPTTADKTILLPNTSGTLITNSDSGTVTSAMIADATIVNGDISTSAAIAFSKLAALTSAQILVGNGSNVATSVAVTGDIAISNAGVVSITANSIVDGDISGSAAISGSKIVQGTTSVLGVLQLTDAADSTSTTTAATPAAVKTAKDAADAAQVTADAALPKAGGTMTGNLILDNASELRFTEADSDGANYTALKAQAQTSDITLTLPATAPTANQVLKANASTPTTLEWATDTTNTAAADLTGSTLASGVTASSLTSVGTLSSLTVSGTITGDVTGDLTGNADTATILATARTIGGVSFNGSANIDLPGVNTAGNQNTTGNAATATKFASAVTIGGVSFDGSANIDLAGVNSAGNQDTSGTAALATQFTVTANNSTDETVYPLFVDGATGSQGAETDTGLSYNPSSGALTATSFVGALTGNASTATILATARDINGVSFNGSADITITAAAGTLTGATLASGVTASSLTSVGTLTGLTSSGDINLNAQADLRFKDADSSHYVALQSPASIASSFTLTLPSADAAVSGYVLASDGAGTLSWVDPGSTSSPTFTGDVSLTNDGALVGFSNLNATYTGNAKTLTVTVATKTGAHRYNGSGSSSGYKIDGKESPFLTLTPGRTYKFDQADSSNTGHPLRFYLEADKTTAYTTGVTTSGTAGSSGAYTQIAVSDTTPSVLHYQCSAHSLMGNSVQTNSNAGVASLEVKAETSDTSCFPLFVNEATGLLAPKANNSLFYNSSTGQLNATIFSGTSASLTSLALTGNATIGGNATITGNLVVNGTTTTVSSTTVEVADKNIELGKVSSPDDTTADGGGLTLKGATDKTWNWVNSTDAWTSSEHIQVASGKTFIGDGSTLTALNASNLSSGTVNVARLGSGSSVTTKFLRGDNTWQTISATPEGTAILSTGESGGTKFLREDGDGTCSWQAVPAAAAGTLTGSTLASGVTASSLTSLGTLTGLTVAGDMTLDNGTNAGKDISWDESANSLIFENEVKAQFGNSTLFHNSIDLYIQNAVGDIRFEPKSGEPGLWLHRDGSVELYDGNAAGVAVKKFETTATGVTITGTLVADGLTVDGDVTLTGAAANIVFDKSEDALEFADNSSALFGTGGDLTVAHYSSGNLSRIHNSGAGGLDIKSTSGAIRFKSESGGSEQTGATYTPAAGWSFGHAGGEKLATSSTGVTITGTATATTFSGSGASLTTLNASNISSGTIAAARVPTLNQDTTGSAATLTTARNINGTSFDGSANITVTAAAGTLTGGTLASGVTASSLTSVGTLTGLTVSGNISMTGTGAIDVAAGTTAQRPGSPSTGLFRYNTTEGEFEGYGANGWGAIGGGGGGAVAGGLYEYLRNQTSSSNYSITANSQADSFGTLTVTSGTYIAVPSTAKWVAHA